MIGTIRKHQQWLWAIIITVVIVTFVIFFSPYSRMSDSRSGSFNVGSINGEKIAQEEYYKAYREVCLRSFFMNGNWPDEEARKQGGEVERETFQWLLLIQKQKQLGIQVSIEAAAQAARMMIAQLQHSGNVTPEIFIRQVLQPHGFGQDDLEGFVRHSLGLEELMHTVGLSGALITPQEIQDLYKREHQELSTAAVFFSASNFLSAVTVPPDVLSQFYSNRLASYRIPDRVQVSYVRFDFTNYQAIAAQELAKITNMDTQVEEMFRRGGTNFLREVKANSLEEARKNIREDTLKKIELQEARRQALEFATPLFDQEPVKAENLDKMAKEKGLTVRVTEPFDERDGPKDLVVGNDFVSRAFSRTPTDPFAGPLVGLDGVYVIAYNKKIPSEIPPLDQIRAKVTRDYQLNQATELARKAGAAFYTTLTNGLAQGKTVPAICTEAKVSLTDLPPVSLLAAEKLHLAAWTGCLHERVEFFRLA